MGFFKHDSWYERRVRVQRGCVNHQFKQVVRSWLPMIRLNQRLHSAQPFIVFEIITLTICQILWKRHMLWQWTKSATQLPSISYQGNQYNIAEIFWTVQTVMSISKSSTAPLIRAQNVEGVQHKTKWTLISWKDTSNHIYICITHLAPPYQPFLAQIGDWSVRPPAYEAHSIS